MNAELIIVWILLVAIICIAAYKMYIEKIHRDYITGLWIGTENFCNSSEIEFMSLLWKHKLEDFNQIHLIVSDISSQDIELVNEYHSFQPYEFIIESNVYCKQQPIWPRAVTIAVNMIKGEMTVYDNEKVYAVLVKHCMPLD